MATMDENVGISLDTDMMDEDELTAIERPHEQFQPQQQQQQQQQPLQMASLSADAPPNIQPNKVHLRGLDNMSTTHVKELLAKNGVQEPGKFEWIDDTSLNLVFADEVSCAAALEGLSLPTELHTAPWDLREAKRAETHPLARLEVRVARDTDKKERGARERSRYYLFHPEDDRVEQREKTRRDQNDNRRDNRREGGRGQYRERDYPDRRSRSGSVEYNRRYYDDAEHSRRNDSNRYGQDGDMYDDDLGSSNNNNRRRSNDGVELFGERRRRSNDNVELFGERPPPRKATEGVELFGDRRPRGGEGVELFPTSATHSRSVSGSRPRRERSRSPVELFPDRRAAAPVGRNDSVELFPEKVTRSDRRRKSTSPSSYRLPTPPRAARPSEHVPEPPRRGQSPPRAINPRANEKRVRSLESRIELFPDRVRNRDGDRDGERDRDRDRDRDMERGEPRRPLEDRMGGARGSSSTLEPGFSIRGAAARDDGGFSIRGAGTSEPASGFSIRGAAGQQPSSASASASANAGVELLPNRGDLFSRVEEPNKGSRRAGRSRAQDLFG